jgi:polysaccharide export outer membrane protein
MFIRGHSLFERDTMRLLTLSTLLLAPIFAQQQYPQRPVSSAPQINEGPNLPVQKIGRDDLIGISVYDAPELTRTVRVGADGTFRLPMLKAHISAEGLLPSDLELTIAAALVKEQVMVDPIVTVSVVEYQSRPVRVVGAVRAPVTFQVIQPMNLLDAISRAEGLTDTAGSAILVTRSGAGADGQTSRLTMRIPVAQLMEGSDPALNIPLEGGEEIRIPEAGRVYVVGNVKTPGAYLIKDGAESSVLKALSLSQGLEHYAGNTAYIYRQEGGAGGKNEIPVDLKKIIERKAPDVALLPNDILFITDKTGTRNTLAFLEKALMIAAPISAAIIYGAVR